MVVITKSAKSVSQIRRTERLLVLLAFAAIYIIWGSTYLAIRYAVESIPPLIVAGVRHLTGGSVLFAWAWLRGYRPTRRDWRNSLVLGALFFLISHGTLHWAEQTVPSGLAALLVATEPMFVAVLSYLFVRERLNWVGVGGLIFGLAGVTLLTSDKAISGQSASLLATAAIFVGTVAWALGMLYSKRAALPTDAVAKSALPLLTGAVMLLLTAGVTGEYSRLHLAQVTGRSLFGLGFLIVFGTIVAFSAYTWLLERRSASLVATHTYVNPVVAVVLGWFLGGEVISARVILSALLVLISVVCVTRGTRKQESETLEKEEVEEAAA